MKAELVNSMGSDLTVVNAARVSFAKHTAVLSAADEKLVSYLAKHDHWTPFAHCTATFRISAPIFVARQLFKHQVGLVVNEVSRRYVDDTPEFFMPMNWRGRPEGSAKQGSSDKVVITSCKAIDGAYSITDGPCSTPEAAADWAYSVCSRTYDVLIKAGVAPEQARMVLPQAMYTEWYWTGSLVSFARICKLRLDPHAQLETRLIAVEIDLAMGEAFPISWKALMSSASPAS